ncbi:hypothetical protein [Chenggangzhangella methanolivorans]|uniref:Uncharacterized protein n=1 Tax=Chenggangzhangella methanolivorans TaxID=1437009 RepID=A0A9E6RCQ6_9HYPH|nr:hypothetical protein [Chenggangzhangella methanolivorans]QZO00838.1 hypothetical protein K6K41_04025 [Chenggangzhangella methanolivorans]
MSGPSEEPTPEMIEAIAKQLFRAENPPSRLWDGKLFEQAGLPTEGYLFASEDEKAAFRRRAQEAFTGASS